MVVEGREVAIFRSRNGRVYATQAQCPHRAGPLADGLLGGSTIICPLHAWKFNLETGEPILGTCTIETYDASVDDAGYVVVRL